MDDLTCFPREALSDRTLTSSGADPGRFAAGTIFDRARFD
jgi:hypothetical protein